MCEFGVAPHVPDLDRRRFLRVSVGSACAVILLGRPGMAKASPNGVPIGNGHEVHPRDSWAAGLRAAGPLAEEAPGDLRFLLVHHTAGSNRYSAADVPGILRTIYRLHTSNKGWADVAYNFFVDRHGGIWEGRTGSLERPIKGDATGGSQGFALLCCFVGDHTDEAPTPAAQQAMIALLAFLASRYEVDTRAGATVTFVSRGSNKWPAGRQVMTRTIAGHRDMSQTACPGNSAYELLNTFAAQVSSALPGAAGYALQPKRTSPQSPSSSATMQAPESVSRPPPSAAPNTTDGAANKNNASPAGLAAAGTAAVGAAIAGLLATKYGRRRSTSAAGK